jgi:hypothetical protein
MSFTAKRSNRLSGVTIATKPKTNETTPKIVSTPSAVFGRIATNGTKLKKHPINAPPAKARTLSFGNRFSLLIDAGTSRDLFFRLSDHDVRIASLSA